MSAYFFLISLAFANDAHNALLDAKTAIVAKSFKDYDKDNGGSIDWSEFEAVAKGVTSGLGRFVVKISGDDGTNATEFVSLGQHILDKQDTASKSDPQLTFPHDGGDAGGSKVRGTGDWLIPLAPGDDAYDFGETTTWMEANGAGKSTGKIEADGDIDNGYMQELILKHLFANIAGADRGADGNMVKNLVDLDIDEGEFRAAKGKVGGAGQKEKGGASFIETTVQTEVDASADKGSLVQDLEQQLRNLDAERDQILKKLQEQKQKQVPVRKGVDTGERKRGFREVEIRPETASKTIDANADDGVDVAENF